MLVLLPPSESKTVPRRGPALDLDSMAFPELNPTRARILDTLVELCAIDPALAHRLLGLGPTQADDVTLNATLHTQPCAPAMRVYSGVLYDALGYASLSAGARRRAQSSLAIASGLWGLTRPKDQIPAYRLSGSVSLPVIGTLASAWRGPVANQIAASSGLILDLRSGTYAALGPVPKSERGRTVSLRVLQERHGVRTVVSHMNKATKGRIVRELLESASRFSSMTDFVAALRDWGYSTDCHGSVVDVVVREL